MRKIISVFLILAMLCSFVACGFGKPAETEKEKPKNNEPLQEETVTQDEVNHEEKDEIRI